MDVIPTFGPLVATLLVLFLLLVWWRWHRERRVRRAHAEALAALATALGGTVVGPAAARAWSADLRPPLRHETGGLVNRVGTVRRARFETALDFRRGRWPVRVSEASVRKHVVTASTTTIREHRVEVAVAALPALRLCRRVQAGGPAAWQAGDPGPAAEVPLSVARDGRPWLPAVLPAPADREFTAFTTDPQAVARAFTPQVAQWLVDQAGTDPFTCPVPLVLTAEAGLVYATRSGRIDPAHVVAEVDLLLGLLDRMGATPAHPPGPA
ncbi:hypothetical protein AB0I60_07515 [Actinosynnema sp. NPDC050436]|uniref:hypothetical protein n=1 Tax=Actinosynnema sp. NPDC050436 TaxID=3155659 RepID=UPI0033FF4417